VDGIYEEIIVLDTPNLMLISYINAYENIKVVENKKNTIKKNTPGIGKPTGYASIDECIGSI